tara:strand:+ start:140 stop:502 length:363 start_codon:yes stop_codon:yes gene_type:complete
MTTEDKVTYDVTQKKVTKTTRTLNEVLKVVFDEVEIGLEDYNIYDSEPYLDTYDDGDRVEVSICSDEVNIGRLVQTIRERVEDSLTTKSTEHDVDDTTSEDEGEELSSEDKLKEAIGVED